MVPQPVLPMDCDRRRDTDRSGASSLDTRTRSTDAAEVSQAPAADFSMKRSSREATNIPKALADWLATELPEGAEPTVTLHSGIDTNGMSSETG